MSVDADRSPDRLGQLLVELADELRPLVTRLVLAAATNGVVVDAGPLPAPESDPWLTAEEAARRVGVHRRTIYRALAAGVLDGGRIETGSGGCRWRIRASDVDRWVGARANRLVTPVRQPRPSRAAPGPTRQPSSYRTRARRTEA